MTPEDVSDFFPKLLKKRKSGEETISNGQGEPGVPSIYDRFLQCMEGRATAKGPLVL